MGTAGEMRLEEGELTLRASGQQCLPCRRQDRLPRKSCAQGTAGTGAGGSLPLDARRLDHGQVLNSMDCPPLMQPSNQSPPQPSASAYCKPSSLSQCARLLRHYSLSCLSSSHP